MSDTSFREEADRCRQQALSYLGRPEASFLLRVAQEFDRLERGDMDAAPRGKLQQRSLTGDR